MGYTIDAAGQTSRTVSITNFPPDGQPVGIYGSMMDMTQGFDGDGLAVKKLGVETLLDSDPEGNVTTTKTSHLVRSSVLGGKVVSEIGTESEQRGFVYLGGAVLALQYRTTQTVNWEHRDAGNASIRMTSSNGTVLSEGRAELDPLGNNASPANTVTPLSPRLWKLTVYPGFGGSGMNGATQCSVDGLMTSCSSAFGYVAAGVGTVEHAGFYGDYVVINHRETPREGLRNFSQSVNNSSPQKPLNIEADRLGVGELNELHSALKAILANKTCSEFVAAMLTEAGRHAGNPPITTNMLDLFNMVKGQNGFAFGTRYDSGPGGTAALGYSGVSGSVMDGDAQVLLSSQMLTALPSHAKTKEWYAYTALGELTHIAGGRSHGGYYGSMGYHDTGLARATEIVATRMGIELNSVRPDPRNDVINASSSYYHNALESICGRK